MSVCLVTIRQHHEAECQAYGCEAIEFFSSMGEARAWAREHAREKRHPVTASTTFAYTPEPS